MSSSMTLHKGARIVDRESISTFESPESTRTWSPVPFETLLNSVETEMSNRGMSVRKASHALSHDNNRMFAVMDLNALGDDMAANASDHWRVAGQNISLALQSSYDKQLAAKLGLGSRVWVCDNLAFSAEIVFKKRNTADIVDKLPALITKAFDQLPGLIYNQQQMQAHWKKKIISDEFAHDSICNVIRENLLPGSHIKDIFKYWDNPEYTNVKIPTVWRLYNAFTSYHKEKFRKNPVTAAQRSMAVTKFFEKSWNPSKKEETNAAENDTRNETLDGHLVNS